MKVLITGVTGFIGSNVTKKLIADGEYEVAGIVRTSSSENRLIALGNLAKDLMVYKANFTDYYALSNAVRKFAPDYVLHIGAQTAVRESFENLHEFSETNYIGTINLIHACLEVPNFKKFIFASTMETYGWQKIHKPFKEIATLHPASPYAVSKAACEYYLEMASKAYNIRYLIARPCNTFGRNLNAGYIVEYLITTMLAGKDVYIGTPDFVRDLMYVDDHVNVYMTLLKSSSVNETFNFSSGSETVIRELAQKLKAMLNYKGKIIETWPPDYPLRPAVEEYLSIDASKAQKVLGWQTEYSVEQGLNKAITYWKKRGVT